MANVFCGHRWMNFPLSLAAPLALAMAPPAAAQTVPATGPTTDSLPANGAANALNRPPQAVHSTSRLLLTNGATGLEGSSGGGLATWATIAGRGTGDQIGLSAQVTAVELPDFGLRSGSIAIGILDRVELSFARQSFNTRAVGASLGLGHGFRFDQDIFGAKIRLFGDIVYGDGHLPQVALGVQHKRSGDADVVRAVGAADTQGTDVYISATKLFLAHSLVANATVRMTSANQGGLLGFGSIGSDRRSLQFEGSLAYQLSRRLIIGGEYRTRPDNLSIAREDDAIDVFAAWAATPHVTLTGAFADLGSIAGNAGQRGPYLQLQLAF